MRSQARIRSLLIRSNQHNCCVLDGAAEPDLLLYSQAFENWVETRAGATE